MECTVGSVVAGKYRIERALGAGGMGTVWVADQEPLGRRVALKVIRPGALGPDARARFEREAKIVAALRCSHIVTLYDFGEHEGAPYIAFELLEGETLRARISRGALPIDEALSLARDIASGLRSAHEMGIVHRDLKPENVVLVAEKDRGTRAKLLDFGVAKPLAGIAPMEAGLTAAGAITGTPGYIAPEVVLRGASDDPRVDLYALGVILFEMVGGAPPFEAATALGLVVAHATQPVPDIRERSPGVPPQLASLIASLLDKDPNGRPADAQSVIARVDALRGACAPTPAVAPLVDPATGDPLELPSRPSIAVQPFSAIGGSEEDMLFAEAISEDILMALSRFKQLFVVAQGTMVQPAGRDSDVLRVGRLLGVRYVVQGNVRRSGERIRVSANLVDVKSGVQLWANRYDGDTRALFELQDEITQAVVSCVAGHVEVDHAERARKMPLHTLHAYDWLARGRALHHRRTVEDNQHAREALDRAVELDPDYAAAHAWRACAYGQALGMGLQPMAPAFAVFVESLNRALVLDDNDSECHRLACEARGFGGRDLVKAEHHHGRAIALNPNDARIVGQAGELAMYMGDLDEAVDALARAMRLDPLGPKAYQRILLRVRYMRDELDEAWRLWRCLDESQPPLLALAAAIAALRGDADSAASLRERVRAMAPDFSATTWVPPFARPEHRERWLRGFEAAGLG